MTELVSYARAAALLDVKLITIVWLVEREALKSFLLLSDKEGGRSKRCLQLSDVERLKAGSGWRRRAPRQREE